MVVRPADDDTYYIEDCERGPIKAGGAGGSPPRSDRLPIMAYRKSRRAQSTEDAETWVDDGLANTLNQYDVGDVRTTHAVVEKPISFYSTGGSHKGFARTDGLSPTLKVGSGVGIPSPPAIATSTVVRRLTPVETERLQFWPDGWTDIPWGKKDHAPDSRRYAAAGNGVTASVSYWIGWRLAEVMA